MKDMKPVTFRILFTALLLCAAISARPQEVDLKSPIGYLNYISAEFQHIQKDTWD